MADPEPHRARWSAAAAGFTVLFAATGVNFAFGILFKPILLELGASRAILALAATASLVVNALGQPVLGALVDRVGPRRVVLPAMALMALGTGLVSRVEGPVAFIACYGVVVAVGNTGAGILPVSVHVSRWFPAERGAVLAVVASGFSLGHLVFTQLAAHLAAAVGWRATYGWLAALLLLFLAATVGWLRDAPREARAAGAARGAGGGAQSMDRGRALRTGGFWALTAGLVGCGFTDFLLTTHLPAFATDLGLSPAVAANAVSLWAAANVVGLLTAGRVADRLGPRPALVLTYLLRSAALFWLVQVRDTGSLYAFAIGFGATFFTTAPLSAALVGLLFGPKHQGVIFGTTNLFHHLAGALGAFAGGLAFDRLGSYRPLFLLSAVMVLGSALVSAFARPPRAARDLMR